MTTKIGNTARLLWNSRTLTTWANIFAQGISLFAVLPLILSNFPAAEITIWYLFSTFIGFQTLFQFGFNPTFSRLVAYAFAGANFDQIKNLNVDKSQNPTIALSNRSTLSELCGTMSSIYFGLATTAFIFLSSFGTLSIWKPLNQITDFSEGLKAWILVVAVTCIRIYGSQYICYLNGTDHIAKVARWQTLFTLLSIATAALVLTTGGSLLELVIAHQSWQILTVVRNFYLSRQVNKCIYKTFPIFKISKEAFSVAWPSAWRSGIGQATSILSIHSLGILYANIATSTDSAVYLLSTRIIQVITNVSQTPFTTKIPQLSKLFLKDRKKHLQVAERGMRLSHAVFFTSILSITILAPYLLEAVGSNIQATPITLWLILVSSAFFGRLGSMHAHLYASANRISWHWASLVQSALIALCIYPLYQAFAVNGLAASLLAGNIGYWGVAGAYSYRRLITKPALFEIRSIVPSLLLSLLISATIFAIIKSIPS